MIFTSMIYHLYKGNDLISFISLLIVMILMTIIVMTVYLNIKYRKKHLVLQNREELFNSLCSNIDDVFTIYHMEKLEYEYISPNLERMLGISSKTFSEDSLSLLEYTDEDSREEILKILNLLNTQKLKNDYQTECQYHHPITNQIRWLIFRGYPVFNRQKIIRYICCISDITREKQSQQILKNALLNAQKANEAKKDFLSHMSHELRTPINAIIGMAQIASNSLVDQEKVLGCLDIITTSSRNLLAIINNILDMAKIDSNKLEIQNESFYMSKLLKDIALIVSNQAEMNKQNFDLVLTDIIDDYVIGDTLRLNQIIYNCVSNALKFTPSGGYIKLETRELKRYSNKALFRFIITDNGKGMSKEYINRLFIPFEQEDSSITRKYGGSGLGMSITKNLITLMDGDIRVTSKLGIGTIVTIDILFEIPCNPTLIKKVEPIIDFVSNYDFSGHRILVVEDNEINLEITCDILKQVKITLDTAKNGYEALKLFENSEEGYYEIILMDIQMPELNGYETTSAIRKSMHPDANVFIIAMSADAYAKDISLTLDCGMNHHMTKPINIESLYSLIQRIFTKEKAFQ